MLAPIEIGAPKPVLISEPLAPEIALLTLPDKVGMVTGQSLVPRMELSALAFGSRHAEGQQFCDARKRNLWVGHLVSNLLGLPSQASGMVNASCLGAVLLYRLRSPRAYDSEKRGQHLAHLLLLCLAQAKPHRQSEQALR